MDNLNTDILVVGGGTGGTAAAIQAARRGAKTLLVSEFPWLGGMLTSAGVSAPDGNELAAFQTGIWGAFLRALQGCYPDGLDHAWVIAGSVPLAVERQGDRLIGVHFAEFTVRAQIILDGTELGDLLALAEIPHRWGWEWQSEWHEPSAPEQANELTLRYPVQAPTWVVTLQDFGNSMEAPEIPMAPMGDVDRFARAWQGYGPESCLNYGRLPGDRIMINWPQQGNDYGERLNRLIASPSARQEFLQEARWHSQNFAHFIQVSLGRRYGLALETFPVGASKPLQLGGGAFALHLYYRESRRIQGLATVTEHNLLPQPGGQVAHLPLDESGEVEAIAIGNYPNDHHYPTEIGSSLTLKSTSIRWGGRWTGTPFTLPYRSLIPVSLDGFLACEKNSSISHIANGATRLQPVVLNLGQAAGMAAALCIERRCQPRELSVRDLQDALLCDPTAPAAIIPLFNSLYNDDDWHERQRYYLDHPDQYPASGDDPKSPSPINIHPDKPFYFGGYHSRQRYTGIFHLCDFQKYQFTITAPEAWYGQTLALVTLYPQVNQILQTLSEGQSIQIWGQVNIAGGWLLANGI
jgi:hypothetical protein